MYAYGKHVACDMLHGYRWKAMGLDRWWRFLCGDGNLGVSVATLQCIVALPRCTSRVSKRQQGEYVCNATLQCIVARDTLHESSQQASAG